ncbi:MAG: Do family serine endopeptidase [Deltaproteobacteria bacterium]|nr:Do family serine endopeptidase [Deltaproteobacteria bacterium]
MTYLQDKRAQGKFFLLITFCSVIAGVIAGTYLVPSLLTAQDQPAQVQHDEKPTLTLPNFVSLARTFEPSLVHISVTQSRQHAAEQFGEGSHSSADPRERFFGTPRAPAPAPRRGLGSGFIIDSDGHILTNYHVVNNADRVIVKLSDNREFDAKIVGRDAKTDIAVIKIDSSDALKAAPLGDSGQLERGEWVVAMGSPFGLDKTLTVGIISAIGRRIGAGPYDNYIQTDASINPGNSGGPLINLEGYVVGVNTAIVSQSGSNIGIGFAIPINLIKQILPDLKNKGKVTRGWLGVTMQTITPSIAESLGLEKSGGALISDVTQGGPADQSGLQRGDVIIEYDGKTITDAGALPILVAQTSVGQQVQVKVLRKGKELPIAIAVGELKEKEVVAPKVEKTQLGLTVQTVDPQVAESLGLTGAHGVLITSVQPGSAAEDAGLTRGDVILEVNQSPVKTTEDFHIALGKSKTNVLFLVRRGESNLFVAMNVPNSTG